MPILRRYAKAKLTDDQVQTMGAVIDTFRGWVSRAVIALPGKVMEQKIMCCCKHRCGPGIISCMVYSFTCKGNVTCYYEYVGLLLELCVLFYYFRFCQLAKDEGDRHPMNQNILINHGASHLYFTFNIHVWGYTKHMLPIRSTPWIVPGT